MTCLQHSTRFDERIRPFQLANDATKASGRLGAGDPHHPRMRLVARIRRQIADGTYDVEGKLDLVLDRMLQLQLR